jgi:type III pantothenate kinase
MKLLIDAGNTRIKWALVRDREWLQGGVLPIGQAAELPQCIGAIQGVRQIWVSNVGGEKIARHIRRIGAAPLHFIVAREMQCGVRNGYTDPQQLGSDRWAALIAARHLAGGSCLVVTSGTATTIDALSETGEFMGGLILPGVDLMQHALHGATAQLKPAPGAYAEFPRNTADALFSGAIQASCGAIQRQHALLGDGKAQIVLSGGAAAQLHAHIGLPVRVVDNLVLQGLLLIAQEAGTC